MFWSELLSAGVALAFALGIGVGVWRLSKRASRRWLEETFGHLRSRREMPDETYSVAETLEEASRWL